MLFTACSSDEHITDTEIWYIAREDKSGDNKITGTFCFLKMETMTQLHLNTKSILLHQMYGRMLPLKQKVEKR